MPAAQFDIEKVIARLQAEVPELQLVEGVAEYATIARLSDFRPPSAYVLLLDERADGEEPSRPTATQRAQVHFGVVLALRNYRDVKGGEVLAESSELISKVRIALKGWQPDITGARPCMWLQGNTLDYDNSVLLWSDVYTTQYFLQ